MICGFGIDMVDIKRMEKAVDSAAFLFRVFTEKERLHCQEHKNAIQTLAGMFAAKEAIAKALGIGLYRQAFSDIVILHGENGAPYPCLHGRALRKMHEIGGARVLISLSHEKEMAIAAAIVEG